MLWKNQKLFPVRRSRQKIYGCRCLSGDFVLVLVDCGLDVYGLDLIVETRTARLGILALIPCKV